MRQPRTKRSNYASSSTGTDTNAGVAAPPTTGRPLRELVDLFFATRRTLKDSPHTTAAYRSDLASIVDHLAAIHGTDAQTLDVSHLTLPAVREAFGRFADTHAKSSITRCWSTWNTFFNFLVADEIRDGNPMAAIPRPRLPRRSPKALKGEDTPEILLQTATTRNAHARHPWPERDLATLATLLLTGLRSAELLSLRVESVAGRAGERRITVTGKGDKTRTVPIEESLNDVIANYLASRRHRFPTPKLTARSALFVDWSGNPLQRGGLQYLVATTLRRAGLADRRPTGAMVHALRHTFATRLAEDGATASEIMHLLGHASLATSQTYIDATAAEQRTSAAANRTYRALANLTTEIPPGDVP